MDCGKLHSDNMDSCSVISERTHSSRKAGKASKDPTHEVSQDALLAEDLSSLSLIECEKKGIADIECLELEDRVLALEGICVVIYKYKIK